MNVQTIVSKGTTPVPPEKGAFPLDHFHECTQIFRNYMECLAETKFNNAEECRRVSMNYLQCRMDK